ncbi:MAG: putative lipid II flippase FtsW [Acidobacteria bacterium]|nr:putative lipid II flippase FtsW [Acidobacteriota bacterium]MBV9476208.1 putative lipid II flippase FtsW [Acidobacteriota bacterium]
MSRKLSFDTSLFGAATLIVVIGLVMIYSASAMLATQRFGHGASYFFMRQLVFLAAGAMAMVFLMNVNPALLQDRRVLYTGLGAIGLFLIVALFQSPINGTHRWIVLPWFQLQPSEFAKPAIVLFLASFLARREERINDLTTTILPVGFILALFAGLILLGRDFGTATTLVLVAAGMIFAAGIAWRYVALIGIALVPVAGYFALSAAYRRERVLTFLNPEADPLDKGFQALQSLIALGTGGLSGLGIGNGRQKLFFLPEPHTDFIFSIIGEELGFLGAIALLALFGFLAWRGFRIARDSQDRFAFYAALGCTLMIAVQALVNVSVALCLLPTKGLPLPLVSYGGSSLIASLIAVGLLLNFSQQSG